MSACRVRAVLGASSVLFLIASATPGALPAQDAPNRAITRIAGDLYRFQNNFHTSVFYVTDGGIVVTDPINADAARWLKDELAERFPDRPVRYLIYSHDHADHISGGEVFADDGATVIAHDNAKADIVAESRPTAVPDVTFAERMTVELGGKVVELAYLGRNHSDNSIVMHFPAERAVFAVDFVSVDRLPFRDLPDGYIDEWIESLKRLEAMDFDLLAPGHGQMGTREDVAEHRRYLEELRAEVLEHARAGRSLDETRSLVTMDAYRDWESYADWLPLNVEGMYRYLQLYRRPN
ncbi:MAG TPA: MBL fold metallo-hydrolase [Geminicoccaceae bacterium]|nr:MBL fold metallo-hydrolase [Geminicoccaceae bacterium]